MAFSLVNGAGGQTALTIDPGRIEADQPLVPGRSYALPTHSVNNGGSQPLRVVASVSDHADGERVLPPSEWFRLEPSEVVVGAGASGAVQATVMLPVDAPEGDYAVWFAFAGAPTEGQGIVPGAAVQVPFFFAVGQESIGWSPWLWAGALAVLVALGVGGAALRRRLRRV